MESPVIRPAQSRRCPRPHITAAGWTGPSPGTVATEEGGAACRQDEGGRRAPWQVAAVQAGLGVGHPVEEAGSPSIEAVPWQIVGLVALLDGRVDATGAARSYLTGFLGTTVSGSLSRSKKLHLPHQPR